MNNLQDQGTEQRSATTGTMEGGARLRRLVRQLSRGNTLMLPLTLLLISASAAQENSVEDGERGGSSNDGPRAKAPTDADAQPGDKIAVLAGDIKVAEHVLTEDEVATGKVRIAARLKGSADQKEAAEDGVATDADVAKHAQKETNAEAATEDDDDKGAIVMADGGGAGGVAMPQAEQQGDDDDSGLIWLFLGLGAVGTGLAIANRSDDNQAVSPPTEEPPPPPPPSQITGEVIKGYLQGAAVYLDTDHDGQPDGEPVYTDSQGRFTFTSDETGASLLAFGGVDTLTNVPLDGLILRAPAGSTVISPLTTLLDEMMKQDDSLSVDEAQSRLASALGLTLPAGIDLRTFDPLENLQNGGSGVEDHSESVLNTIAAIQSLLVGAGAVDAVTAANAAITAMAQTMLAGDGALDLRSAADVARVLEAAFSGTGVGASNVTDFTQLAEVIASVNHSLIEASGLSDAALQATRYALTGFQDLLTSIGAGARISEQYERDISFSQNGELASAIEALATSGGVEEAIGQNIAASISYAQRLEGDRFVFALNPELKLYQGAPDKIDTVTVRFGASGVAVEREVRGANGEVSLEVLLPGADGTYTLQYSELDKIFIRPPVEFNGQLGAEISVHYVGLGVVESDTLGIVVTSVNDAPTGQDSAVTTSENLPHVFTVADFPFTDGTDEAYVGGADALDAVKIVSLPQAGTLYLGDMAITAQDVADGFYVSAADIAAGVFRFVPSTGENGDAYASFQFQVRDDGGTANGGVDLDGTAHTLLVNVAAVNDAPTANGNTSTIDEDASYTFALQDFNFTDMEGDDLAALIITSLPAGGTLWHGEHELTLDELGADGYSVSATDLSDGLLRFVPDANTNGSISFDFRVQDDGGTANGGVDISEAATFTINVTSVNDAPAASGNSFTIDEDETHTFAPQDFNFTDIEGEDLAALIITSLPEGGTLWHGDHEITLDDVAVNGYSISAADIAGGLLTFVPETNANGDISFDFRVQDDGGTANGGADTSASATFTVNVTAINDAPVASSGNATILEDGEHTFSAADFGFTDVEDDSLAAVIITSLPEGGTLWHGANEITLDDLGADGYSISAADIVDGLLSFVSDMNANGSSSFEFSVQDDGGAANGGADVSEPTTFTVSVTALNDAPTTTGGSATVFEDGEYTISASDLAFTDVEDNALASLIITSLPEGGTLWFDGEELIADDLGDDGYSISARDLADGMLVFRPDANSNEPISFNFRLQDDGGTADGGADTGDAATFTFDVTSVNDAPVNTGGGATIAEGGTHTFTATDFAFTDVDSNVLSAVLIDSLPEGGTLWHGDREITPDDVAVNGYSISAADIAGGLLAFVPDANANGDSSFDFRVQDDGGTANEGADTSASTTFTVSVTAINDAPVASSGNATILEDGEHIFSAPDFGFTDVEDDSFAAVIITSLPEGGTLRHGANEITLDDLGVDGYSISAADIVDGLLSFVPDANANGSSSFEFSVQDDGGTTNGGADISEPATFTINVTSVSDVPLITGGSATILEDGEHTFSASDFAFTDAENHSLLKLIIGSLPTGGSLQFSGNALSIGDLGVDGYAISAQDLADGKLVYVPDAGTSGTASFGFRVQDDGGVANGGGDTSAQATFTLTVTAVNDAPSTAAGSTTIAEGASYTFEVSDFSFTDPDGDQLSVVLIDSLPSSGTLYFDNRALELSDVTDGLQVTPEEIASGLLRFEPADDQSAAADFSFRVRDVSGTGNGGMDTSTSATFTVNVTQVNDAPVASGGTVECDEGESVTLAESDFGYTDAEGNSLAAVIITSLPDNGTLFYGDDAITLDDLGVNGYSISAADLADGKLEFVPNAGYNGSISFDYQVQDDGGTAVGGNDLSDEATLTLNVSAVNDAPTLSLPDYSTGVSPQAVGAFFPVNTFTTGSQENPSIAALADGGFVVVWMSKGQDTEGNDFGVYAQRFDASGEKVGGELQVNQLTAGDQFDPAVVAVPGGGFAVVWSSVDEVGGANIHTRTFYGDGEPLSSESTFGTAIVGDQFQPAAAVGANGTIAIWTSDGQDGSGFGIYGRVQHGEQTTGDFRINTTTSFDQFAPQAVALADGSYVVTWTGNDGDNSRGIFAQRVSATGELLDSEFRVNTGIEGDQVEPAIAALSDGGFVITWTSPDESGKGVYLQRYDGQGVALGEQLLVNSNQNNDQLESAVTALPTGGFVVTWTSWGSVDSTLDIYAQRFGIDGEPLSTAVLVNSYTTYEQTSPAITVLNDGGIVITWQSNLQDSSSYGIYGQRFEPFAPNYIEDGAAVPIAPMANVADAELDALNDGNGDWSGASITIGRSGDEGVIAFESDDFLDFIDGDGYALNSTDRVLTKDGQVIATYAADDGVLVVSFGSSSATAVPTSADVNYLLQHFTYASGSDDLTAGSIKFHYSVDDGNTGSQGSGGAGVSEGTVDVQLTDVNDAPVAGTNSLTMSEDGTHTFSNSDFAFTDAEGDSLQAVIISSLPEHGTLTLNGEQVEVNDAISVLELGSLVYTPSENYSGSDGFGYQLRDDGGTVHGGLDTSSIATMTLTVNAVNDAPTLDLPAVISYDHVVTTREDTVDPNDNELSLREAIALALDGQSIGFSEQLLADGPIVIELDATLEITKAIYINGAPAGGDAQVELRTDGSFSAIYANVEETTGGAILEGFVVSGNPSEPQVVTDIESAVYNDGTLTLANVTIKDYTQQGGRAFGDVISALLNSADGRLYLSNVHIENTQAAGWNATDANPGSSGYIVFNSGHIHATDFYIEGNTAIGGNGTVANPGAAYIYANVGRTYGEIIWGEGDDANEFYSATNNYEQQGTAGQWSNNTPLVPETPFVYEPPVLDGRSSADYTEGAPAVQLAPGATLADPDLDALNEGAGNWSGASITVQRSDSASSEDGFNFIDANDLRFDGGSIYKTVGADESVIGTYTSANGVLTITFAAAGSVVASSADADHVLQQITYSNSSNDPDSSVALTYTVNDGNSGAQGSGAELTASGTLIVNITAVNDVPEATATIVTIDEDQRYTFGTSDFGFTDTESDSLAAVVINSLPTNGTLFLDGVAITSDQVTAGFEVSAEDLACGNLTFTPSENYYGSTSFGFSVRDNGGTANDGEDTSESATFTFDMRSVNDVPMLDLPAVGYDYVVTTLTDTDDSGDNLLSLREALAMAQNGESITFSDEIFGSGDLTLVLSSALRIDTAVYINGASGDNRITLEHSGTFLTAAINVTSNVGGNGAVLQGFNLTSQAIAIFVNTAEDAAGVSNHGVLTLADFNITGLEVSTMSTSVIGVIFNASTATLNASNVTMSGNSVWGLGGGIEARDGGDAAIVWNEGTMNLNLVTMDGNHAFGGDGSTEGAWNGGDAYIFVNNGNVTGSDSIAYSNQVANIATGGAGNGEGIGGDDEDFLSEQTLEGDPVFTFTPPDIGDGTPSVDYSSEDGPVLLAPEASLHDIELDALNGGSGNWSGATITVQRHGGVNSDDVFGHQTPLGLLPPALVWQDNGTITKSGAVIATYTNSAGQLQLHFTGFGSNIPTTADVNELLRQITYSNSGAPESQVTIEYRVSDGNASFHGLQGSGGEGVVTGTVTVHMEMPPLGTPMGVSLEESQFANAQGDGNTKEYLLSYRVDLPEAGAYEGSVVQLYMRGTNDPVAMHTLTEEDIAQGWASLQPAILPSEGTYVLSARLADASDTEYSEFTAPFFTVVDRTLPDAPVLDFTSLTLREDDANSGFVLSGSAEAFAAVQVFLSASGYDPHVYWATADADGRFQVSVNPTWFGDETNITVTAVVKDRAENASPSATATLTLIEAAPAANEVAGAADEDEVFAEISGDAVVFEPGLDGGNDYFIGATTAFDTVRIAGNSADYTITRVEGIARDADQTILQGQGHSLLADEPLYLIRAWTGSDTTELRVQADAIEFNDAMVRLTDDGVVGTPWPGSQSMVTLHDGAGDERIAGGVWHDTLFSLDGNDWLDGGSGNDTLLSVSGNDTLVGSDGNDILVVFGDGAGVGTAVQLYGGIGNDVFVVAPQMDFHRDVTIHDFVIGQDKIDLSWLRIIDGSAARELTLDDLDVDQLNAELQADGETQIDLGQFLTSDTTTPINGTLTVTLAGGASTLTESDFILAQSASSLPSQDLMLQAYQLEMV